jgi:hypothetical protein
MKLPSALQQHRTRKLISKKNTIPSRCVFLGDGDLAAVKTFINEKGISINAQDEFGYSAL